MRRETPHELILAAAALWPANGAAHQGLAKLAAAGAHAAAGLSRAELRAATTALKKLRSFAVVAGAPQETLAQLDAYRDALTSRATADTPDVGGTGAGDHKLGARLASKRSGPNVTTESPLDERPDYAAALQAADLDEAARDRVLRALRDHKAIGMTAKEVIEIGQRVTGVKHRSASAALQDLEAWSFKQIRQRKFIDDASDHAVNKR